MDNEQFLKADLLTKLCHLSKTYPFFEYSLSGKSLLGRDIPLLRIGTGCKTVLMVAGADGCDAVSEELLWLFALDFCRCAANEQTVYGLNCAVASATRQILILPRLNPDGRALAHGGADPNCPLYERQLRRNGMKDDFSDWRGNARGVLPKLNFGDAFAERRDPPVTGEFPESEPETAFAVRTVQIFEPVFLLECCEHEQDLLCTNRMEILKRICDSSNFERCEHRIPGAASWFSNSFGLPCLHITFQAKMYTALCLYPKIREVFFRSLYTLAV